MTPVAREALPMVTVPGRQVPPPIPWSPETVRRVTTGIARSDEASFLSLHDAFADRVRRYLLVLGRGDEETAHDALQETFLRVVRYARPMEDVETLWGWLRRLARTALVDLLRRGRRHGGTVPLTAADEVPEPADDGSEALLEALNVALQELDPSERALVQARYAEGLDLGSIAEREGTTAKAAESRLARLRGRLRETITRRLRHG